MIFKLLSPQEEYDILFVGNTQSWPDAIMKDSLESWRPNDDDDKPTYRVKLIDGADYENEDHAYYKLVYISESIASSDASYYGKSGFLIPCFLAEPYALDKPYIRLGAVTSNSQTAVLPNMEITDDFNDIVRDYWTSGDEVTIIDSTIYRNEWPDDIFQYEVDLEDSTVGAAISYTTLGTPVSSGLEVPWGKLPSWVLIDEGSANGDGVEIPSEIIIHAFQEGAALKGTSHYWKQVRRSIQYLIGDLPNSIYIPKAELAEFVNLSPNPTVGELKLEFILKEEGSVEISLINMSGQRIRTLDNRFRASGKNIAFFDFSDLQKGLYLIQLKRGRDMNIIKVIVE